jgi:hypothetical protein
LELAGNETQTGLAWTGITPLRPYQNLTDIDEKPNKRTFGGFVEAVSKWKHGSWIGFAGPVLIVQRNRYIDAAIGRHTGPLDASLSLYALTLTGRSR